MTTFLALADPEYARLENVVYKSYPSACILGIEKVEYSTDLQMLRYQEILEEDPSATILELYHGTKREHVDAILATGFQVEKNRTAAYGRGTYFSNSASFAFSYTNPSRDDPSYMFVCSVVSTDKGTYCARTSSPQIFRSPHDDLIVPLYLISFVMQSV
jgi:hypothetical protein